MKELKFELMKKWNHFEKEKGKGCIFNNFYFEVKCVSNHDTMLYHHITLKYILGLQYATSKYFINFETVHIFLLI